MNQTNSSSSQAAWTASDLRVNPHAAPDKAERVRRMFAAIARRYDLNNRLHSLGRDQVWRRKAVQLCEVRPIDRVLDVACGTGDLAFAFARAHPASVTGLDFTAEMLEIAEEKNRRFRLRAPIPSLEFIQGDALNLPFPDRSFEIVSIAFGIRNVADPLRALREFHRVLNPETGRLIVLEFSQPRNALLRALNGLYTRRVMPLTAALIAGDRSGAYRYLPQSIATFQTAEEFAQQLGACGFMRIESHPLTFGICTAHLART